MTKCFSHHSLVTPIDWKLRGIFDEALRRTMSPLAGDTY